MQIYPTGHLEQLQNALLDAFNYDSLTRLVRFELDLSLEWVTPVQGKRDLTTVVANLVIYCASQKGGLHQLLAAACKQNKTNHLLNTLSTEWANFDFFPLPLPEDHVSIHAQQKSNFISFNVDDYQIPIYISKELLSQWQEQLLENHLLILHNQFVAEKARCIYIDSFLFAYSVSTLLKRAGKIEFIYQWDGSKDRSDIQKLLRKDTLSFKQRTLFIFQDVSPKVVHSHALQDLVDHLSLQNQYTIFTTKEARIAWGLNEVTTKYWAKNVSTPYDEEDLIKFFRELLSKQQIACISDDSLKEIISQLPSHPLLERFVARFNGTANFADKVTIQNLIIEIQNLALQDCVESIYKEIKDEKDRLLVVGLTLFGNLMESQFFAAMQRLINGPWKYHFHPQDILDYYHLFSIEQLFEYQDIPESYVAKSDDSEPKNEQRVALKFSSIQRQYLLKVFRQNCQLHLFAALPIFVDIIIESVEIKAAEKIQYSSQHKRNYLRRVMSESLSETALRFPLESEKYLLELAAFSGSRTRIQLNIAAYGVNRVAAEAIALWFRSGFESQFYKLMERWFFDGNAYEKHRFNNSTIQRTLAMTVSYVIYDNDKKDLPKQLYELAWKFACHSYIEARFYFMDYIFPQLSYEYTHQILTDWENLHQQLLFVAQYGKHYSTLIDLFSRTTIDQAKATVQTWLNEWAQAIPKLSLGNIGNWTLPLAVVTNVYEMQHTPDQLTKVWLEPWFKKIAEQDAPQQDRALVVRVLKSIRDWQKTSETSNLLLDKQVIMWFFYKEASPIPQQIAWLYFAQIFGGNASKLATQAPALPTRFTQTLTAMIAAVCTLSSIVTLQDLLPVALVTKQEAPESFKKVIEHLRVQPDRFARLGLGLQCMIWFVTHRHYFRLRNWLLLFTCVLLIVWFWLS